MKKSKFLLFLVCFSILGCKGQVNNPEILTDSSGLTFEEKQKIDLLNSNSDPENATQNPTINFRSAAKKVTPGVVHIRSTYAFSEDEIFNPFHDDFWYHFFPQMDSSKVQSDASGVIVSSDGYIVTNAHVVDNAEIIEVILHNQKIFKAKIIGTDPETDLALLKIQEVNLPFIAFGNSDEVEVGDWVLAVGNPFNLTSTVTAGIVSAKARNINILKGKGAVESYIQTDAAINPGNSGGALVDYNGKLIGINSAISTPTGAYAGYSFAIPINIVKKIIDDLLISGKVRRGYLGVVIKNLADGDAKKLNSYTISSGIFIESVISGGAAKEAGLQEKDIITAIDGHPVETTAQFQEIMVQKHPKEKIILTIIRSGKEKKISVILKENEGEFSEPTASKKEALSLLGVELEELPEREKKRLKLPSGLKVTAISKGKIYYLTNIKKGFIITKVNGKPVNTLDEFANALAKNKEMVTIEGVYPNLSTTFIYSFSIE